MKIVVFGRLREMLFEFLGETGSRIRLVPMYLGNHFGKCSHAGSGSKVHAVILTSHVQTISK